MFDPRHITAPGVRPIARIFRKSLSLLRKLTSTNCSGDAPQGSWGSPPGMSRCSISRARILSATHTRSVMKLSSSPFKWRHYEAEVINPSRPLVMRLSAQLPHLEEMMLELRLSATKQIDCMGFSTSANMGGAKIQLKIRSQASKSFDI
jgi:hypothetical protein